MTTKEKLTIKNFLVLKDVRLEVRKFNIIIGEQSSGKSVVAKLVYYFRTCLREKALSYRLYEEENSFDNIEKHLEAKFRKWFPSHSWGNSGFVIKFEIGKSSIEIKRRKNSPNLQIIISEDISKVFKVFQEIVESKKKQSSEDRRFSIIRNIRDEINKTIEKRNLEALFHKNSEFIPSSRSIYANLQSKFFSFLAEDVGIDPFLTEFAVNYEDVKHYDDIKKDMLSDSNKEEREHQIEVDRVVQSIIKGKTFSNNGKIWIEMKHGSVLLQNASSGQQEAVPMLLTLSISNVLNYNNSTFFIEEPEAHLHPDAQYKIIKLISIMNKNFGFFITTHSPYILAALNNYIEANNIIKKNKNNKSKVEKIMNSKYFLDFSDVGAYSIEDGKLIEISHQEERLIDAVAIDGISEKIQNEFLELLKVNG